MSQRVADELENRRGLVLGLTLAELLLLLLFLLLLALSWRMTTLQKETQEERGRATTLAVRVEELEVTLRSLSPILIELKKRGRIDVTTIDALVKKISQMEALEGELSNLRQRNTNMTSELRALKAATADRDKLQEFHEAVEAGYEIDPDDPPAALVRAAEVLKRIGANTRPEDIPPGMKLSELQGKLSATQDERDKFQRQLRNLQKNGNGLTYPSCWTTLEGQTEYMFDVTINDGGLVVRDATPSRLNDPQMKLVQPFGRNVLVNEAVFQQATAHVFAWSKQENCRFYAIIRDNTGETSKATYKRLRTLVESHFYPLHLQMTAGRQQRGPSIPPGAPTGVGGPFIPVPPGFRTN